MTDRPITTNRGALMQFLLTNKVPNDVIAEIVRPMRDKTQEEKEAFAAELLNKYRNKMV